MVLDDRLQIEIFRSKREEVTGDSTVQYSIVQYSTVQYTTSL